MLPDGGGGATILIDPDSLRRAGSRIKGVAAELQRLQAALSSLDVPLLPPSVAGLVPDAISAGSAAVSSSAPDLEDVVVELTRRAFWAEYADQLMAGYTLSGAALKEFQQYMADGTLLRYATADEARAAGVEVAKLGASFRKSPSLLFSLAASLKGGESVADPALRNAFAAGFVNEFGATRLNEIPRAIQALESSRQLAFDANDTDPFVLRDLAQLAQQQGIELHGTDPVKDLLAPFSVALADATTAGLVTRTVEQRIASNKDAWSTAALLSQGDHFGTPFLVDCFKSGVVDKIAQESPYHILGNLSGPQLPVEYTLGWSDGHPLPADTKQIVLAALARNPEAASLALTQPIDVQAANEYGQWDDVHDPLQLLYRYGHFGDHGSAFGHAYAAATDYLNRDGATPGELHDATTLTANALNLTLDGGDAPAPDQSAFKDGLAHDLALHHIDDLFDSAVADDPRASGIDVVHGDQLRLTQSTLTDALKTLGERPQALAQVLHAGSIYQAALVDQGTSQPPGSDTTWAYKAGAFDATVLNAGDLSRLDHFNAADERHQLIAGFFKDVVNDTIEIDNPVAGAIVHNGVDAAIDGVFPGPDPGQVITDNAQAKSLMVNSLHSSIVSGYYRHGYLADAHAPATIVNGSQLIPYGDAKGDARWDYEGWMNGNTQVHHVTQQAYEEVSRALAERGVDLV